MASVIRDCTLQYFNIENFLMELSGVGEKPRTFRRGASAMFLAASPLISTKCTRGGNAMFSNAFKTVEQKRYTPAINQPENHCQTTNR